MKPNPPRLFRQRLLAVAACPIGVAVAAAVACPESLLIVASVGIAFAAVAAVMAWTLTRPVTELVDALGAATADEHADDLPTSRRDELGTIANAFAELIGRLTDTQIKLDDANAKLDAANALQADTVTKFMVTLESVAGAMNRVGNGTPATPLTLELPQGVSGEPITAACVELNTKVNTVRQRLAALTRIIQGCPMPIVATDDRGTIRFANTAAEQTLGRQLTQLVRSPLGNHIRPTTESDPTGIPSMVLTGVADWLTQGGRLVVAESTHRGVRVALVGSRSVVANDGMWCVVARELSDDHRRIGVDRARTREEILRSVLALGERQAGMAGEIITAQARQLINDAKQSPQRDTLVPRLKAIRETAGHLDGQARLARWLTIVMWADLPAPSPVEFLAAESVRSVIDLLSVRLKEAELTVNVSDAGGWLYCDEEWFSVAVLGVLTHAASSARGGPVGVRLRRLPCRPGESEGSLEVEVVDAGPPLTAEQTDSLTRPLGDLAPSGLLPGQDDTGFVPGLLVAAKLATALGGEMTSDTTPSGRLVVRLVIPTRLPGQAELPAASRDNYGEPAASEELCMGWQLGMSS
jgi:signal transduction histidine kinase